MDDVFGPVNNAAQLERVRGVVDRAPAHAGVLTGGHSHMVLVSELLHGG